METIKQAYRDLGLPDNASKEEVEKKYSLLLRRARSHQARGESASDDGLPSLEAINAAYRTIVEHEENQAREEFNQKAYGKYKGMSGSAQKLDHFFSYYKFHLLGAIVLIAAVVYGINSYINHKEEQAELAKLPPAALAVSYFGEFGSPAGNSDLKMVEDKLVGRFPDWQRVIVHLTYVPAEPKSGQDMAMVQKSILDLITNKDDVYLLDRPSFDKLAFQNALLPLETHADKLGEDFDSKGLSAAAEDTPTEQHVYGVDITDSPLIKSLGLEGGTFIVGIRSDTTRLDHALEFIHAASSDTSAP